jgi:Dna[CI] antecedent, DciA
VKRELGRFGPQGAIGETTERWPAAVGAEIARNAWPARFRRDGTLVVHARDSVWAFELAQQAAEIAKRLEVPGLQFVPGPLPEAAADEIATPPPAPAAVSPEQRRAAEEMTAHIADDELRKVVQRAVAAGLAQASGNRSF